jgi:hypothetical protein
MAPDTICPNIALRGCDAGAAVRPYCSVMSAPNGPMSRDWSVVVTRPWSIPDSTRSVKKVPNHVQSACCVVMGGGMTEPPPRALRATVVSFVATAVKQPQSQCRSSHECSTNSCRCLDVSSSRFLALVNATVLPSSVPVRCR